jgi:hypothetical protein
MFRSWVPMANVLFCQCGNLGSQIWLINSLNGCESTYFTKKYPKKSLEGRLWTLVTQISWFRFVCTRFYGVDSFCSLGGKYSRKVGVPDICFLSRFFNGRHMRTYGFIADYMEFIVNMWGPVFFWVRNFAKISKIKK